MAASDESSDLRLFLREQTVRNDRIWRVLRADIKAGQRKLDALVKESARQSEASDVALDELFAQRAALFRILDRLPEPGG